MRGKTPTNHDSAGPGTRILELRQVTAPPVLPSGRSSALAHSTICDRIGVRAPVWSACFVLDHAPPTRTASCNSASARVTFTIALGRRRERRDHRSAAVVRISIRTQPCARAPALRRGRGTMAPVRRHSRRGSTCRAGAERPTVDWTRVRRSRASGGRGSAWRGPGSRSGPDRQRGRPSRAPSPYGIGGRPCARLRCDAARPSARRA